MKRYLIFALFALMLLLVSCLYFDSYYKDKVHKFKEETAAFFNIRLLGRVRVVSKEKSEALQEKQFWEERANELFAVQEKQENTINVLKGMVNEVEFKTKMLEKEKENISSDKNKLVSSLEKNQVELKGDFENARVKLQKNESQLKEMEWKLRDEEKAKKTAFNQIKNLLMENDTLTKKLEEEKKKQEELLEKHKAELEIIKKQLDDKNKELEKLELEGLKGIVAKTEEKHKKEKQELVVSLQKAEKELADVNSKLTNLKEEIEKNRKEKQDLLMETQNSAALLKAMEDKSKKFQEEAAKLTKNNQDIEEQLKKTKAASFYNIGVMYMQGKKYEEAIAEYEKVLEVDENHLYAHYNLGVLYDSYKKQFDKAVIHYEKYLKLMPDAKDAEKVKEWLKAARQKVK